MAYTNSSLISYTKLSPHHSGLRNHIIDTISIHCMAGNLSVETCGNIFMNREASSNYGIGSDGRIALYVEEKNRSWCTSSSSNDNRAITIEVANDSGAPDWHVSDKAMAALIQLCADICRRNSIKELKWEGNKNLIGQVNKQNMTVHRWFAAKACPGDYLYNKHSYIATEVNKILGSSYVPTVPEVPTQPTTPSNPADFKEGDIIKLKSNATYYNGVKIPNFIFKSTLYYRGKNDNGIIFSTQKTGAITGVVKESAIEGTDIKPIQPIQPNTPTEYKEGDIIKLKSNATYYNGVKIPLFVFKSTLYYRGKNDNGIIISTQKTGAITGVVKESAIEGGQSSTPPSTSTTYQVKVTTDALNIRRGPNANTSKTGCITDRGIYTIVETTNNWGRLKSGLGWICLDYTKRI